MFSGGTPCKRRNLNNAAASPPIEYKQDVSQLLIGYSLVVRWPIAKSKQLYLSSRGPTLDVKKKIK